MKCIVKCFEALNCLELPITTYTNLYLTKQLSICNICFVFYVSGKEIKEKSRNICSSRKRSIVYTDDIEDNLELEFDFDPNFVVPVSIRPFIVELSRYIIIIYCIYTSALMFLELNLIYYI